MAQEQPIPLFFNLEELSLEVPPLLVEHLPKAFTPLLHEDYPKAAQFLFAYRGWETTYHAYRREIERLLLWSWYTHAKSALDLSFQEFEDYIAFCQHPAPSLDRYPPSASLYRARGKKNP